MENEKIKCDACGNTNNNIVQVGSQYKCLNCALQSEQYSTFVKRIIQLEDLYNEGMTSVEIADVVEDDPSNVSSKLGRLYKFGLLDRTRPRGQRAFVYTISKEGLSQLDSPEIVTKPKTKKIKKVHTELENQITDLKLTLVDRNKEVEQLTIENKHKDNEINELKSEISDLNDILTRVTGGVTDYLLKYKTDSKNVGKEIIELLLGRRSST